VTQTIGIIAGIFTASSLLPQAIKIVKEKKSGDVSIGMLIFLMTGVSLWIYYGYLRDDLPIIITNCFSLLLNIITLFLRIKYK
jgi:MtN3 and saliva related transmembrane protein